MVNLPGAPASEAAVVRVAQLLPAACALAAAILEYLGEPILAVTWHRLGELRARLRERSAIFIVRQLNRLSYQYW